MTGRVVRWGLADDAVLIELAAEHRFSPNAEVAAQVREVSS
jgi:hypothetical protein